ncbi:F0F1 ATP synthase subunit delta [Roseisolibacter sp. H3M3-2]|uniref:F0F1 ATP synthase subunit delta n=1 Tax=Roseisolibacter sp. H3M3-2 TaxID=3031323 RepID=UPI0023DAC02A|nr:F0F1 ATP synthase subunit delta [Roseisolibacter sp. H3M3-2]MDF1501436.1 F0F1 ATP synthase subunit delta [Roseisolibacter sp. H3M3-2]
MRDATIARNYADVLLSLARKGEDPHGWGRMARELADAVERDVKLRRFLESPRLSAERKSEVLAKAFQDRFPRVLVRFLQTLVAKGRQMLLPQIVTEYFNLLDEAEGRVHARVTVARAPSADEEAAIAAQLSRSLGKQVVPHVAVNPAILGGVVVKVGDTVMDGSVRRRLSLLRTRMAAR